ncbi:putative cellulase [Leptodontidium sp. MPI-SDFR-AT-0119]|nr:putative cellulase [Leptodontidium sp. MPI-SDFR-AT-0119]
MSQGSFVAQPGYLDWRKFKANGVNLGSWFCLEYYMVPEFFATHGHGAKDEWALCKHQGANLGPILENHYKTFFSESDIDTFAAVGVNLLRIPTTYAAWIVAPGSPHYHGNQLQILKQVATYAIEKYDMHIVLDLHSLPGGVNWLEIGEAIGHGDWFYSETNLELSYQAVKAVIQFIQSSGHIGSYTLAPVNEAVDSKDLRTFGTDLALSPKAAEWLLRYFLGTMELVEAVNPNIPVMLQDSFKGEAFWAQQLPRSANVVIDTHHYYFAGRSLDMDSVPAFMVEDAKTARGTGSFPVLIGEWSLEAEFNNNLALRGPTFDAGRYLFDKYVQGSCFWAGKVLNSEKVHGEGAKRDYWSYFHLIKAGVIQPSDPSFKYE